MFVPGDYVVNANNGVCRITETITMDLTDSGDTKPYFLLIPVEESSARVYIPVDTAEKRIRLAMTEEEALEIMERIPEIEEIKIQFEKERETKYKAAIRSCDPEQLFGIIKTLYRRKQIRIRQGKKSTAVDERYSKMAENHLYEELAFAIGCEKDEIEEKVAECLHSLIVK